MSKKFNNMTVKEYLDKLYNQPETPEECRMFNKELIEEYPFLECRNVWSDEKMEDPYAFTWFDDMPKGWAIAFGLDMMDELKAELIKYNYMQEFRILQIKEKFGGLRFYTGPYVGDIQKIIDKYEDMSYNTCVSCGKPAKYESKGWICPYCEECATKILNRNNERYEQQLTLDEAFVKKDWEDSDEK